MPLVKVFFPGRSFEVLGISGDRLECFFLSVRATEPSCHSENSMRNHLRSAKNSAFLDPLLANDCTHCEHMIPASESWKATSRC